MTFLAALTTSPSMTVATLLIARPISLKPVFIVSSSCSVGSFSTTLWISSAPTFKASSTLSVGIFFATSFATLKRLPRPDFSSSMGSLSPLGFCSDMASMMAMSGGRVEGHSASRLAAASMRDSRSRR